MTIPIVDGVLIDNELNGICRVSILKLAAVGDYWTKSTRSGAVFNFVE